MTYQRASGLAILKRIIGWLLFLVTLLSTFISVCKFLYAHSEKQAGVQAVMLDFIHLFVEMIHFNTPFLSVFWAHSPEPDFVHQNNVLFWILYWLMFVGLALKEAGARMSRQAKFLRESVEDTLILEQAKGDEGLSEQTLFARLNVPNHSVFSQVIPLYIMPVVVAAIGYLCLRLVGFL